MPTLSTYRVKVEEHLLLFIDQMAEKNRLQEAFAYALLNGGKRLRPIVTLMIADALGKKEDVTASALSVEFFHTASLIADDLPSMDNDDVRRERPSLHKVFGEDVAILASYALIAEGYGGIHRNSVKRPHLAVLCLEAATRCAGVQGATNGQFLDLYPPYLDLFSVRKIIYQKTVTLFEIAFIFGWLFGGGDPQELARVKQAALHLGMAFQIADDLLDEKEEKGEVNISRLLGRGGG